MILDKLTSIKFKLDFALLLRFLLLSLIIFLNSEPCLATTVSLEWDSSSAAIGYKLYYQADSSNQPFIGAGAVEGPSPITIQNQTIGKITGTISGLDPSHGYYIAVTAYNSDNQESSYSNIVYVPAFVATLSISFSGSGSGSINSSPSGIACELGTCSATFDIGSSVTLLATPSSSSTSLSYLNSWTGCTSTIDNSCTVALNTSTNVSATFSTHPPVYLANSNSYYSSLQTAFNNVTSSGTIQAQAVNIPGNLTTSNKVVTFSGGYNATYSGKSGYTMMQGTLTISTGSVTVDNIIIGPSVNSDSIPPTTTSFSLPASSSSLTVPISSFVATDNVGVASYCVTTTNSPSACVWSGTVPSYVTFGGTGSQTAWAWARDAAGNISSGVSATTNISMTSLTIGETSILSDDDSGNAGLLLAQSTTLSQTATIQSMSFYVTTASGNLRLGLYDATGTNGGPGNLLASTAEITATTGWNTANVTTPVSLNPGNYWLAFTPSNSGLHCRHTYSSGTARWYPYTYGTMPSTFSPYSSTMTSHWSLYATFSQ